MISKLTLALHVLRGRPLMYRVRLENGIVQEQPHTIITECAFIGHSGVIELNEKGIVVDLR